MKLSCFSLLHSCDYLALPDSGLGVGVEITSFPLTARIHKIQEGTRRRRANKRGRRLLVTLGLSKVTRQAAQRWRNPVEDGVLVSCAAKPCYLDGDI